MLNLSTCFSFFVAVYVILNRYASPIPKLTLSEFILAFFWGAFLMFHSKKIRIEWVLIPFCVYLLGYIALPFTGIFSYIADMTDLVGTAARLLFIYISIAVLGKSLFNLEKGIKFVRWVAIGLAVYACVQMAAAQMGIYLTTYIPFLPVMGEYNTDMALLRKAGYGLMFRPCSLLTEPSHLASYLVQALALGLFAGQMRISFKYCIFLSVVCLISRSSMGLMVVVGLWLLFFLQNHKLTKQQFSIGIVISILGVLFAWGFIYQLGLWDYFVSRVFSGGALAGIGESTRFYAIGDMFAASDSFKGILFGQGLSQTENYLPGFARVYLCLGLVGLFLIGSFLMKIYLKGALLQKKITILFVVLNIGTSLLLGGGAVLPLCIMIATVPLVHEKNKDGKEIA